LALTTQGKVLYGATFVLFLPLALIAWASATARSVRLPPVSSLPFGLSLVTIGALLSLLGMRDLWVHGGGLPMNAAPPPHYVNRGVYRLVPHPIYTGFCVLCVGVSISASSASGLWLISPLAILGCVALVLGYERHDLKKRFGYDPRSLLPAKSPSPPSVADRLACYAFMLSPWFVIDEAVNFLGRSLPPLSHVVPSGKSQLLIESSNVIYASSYVGFALAPLVARARSHLREIAIHGLAAMAFAVGVFLAIPLVLPPSPFASHRLPGRGVPWGTLLDNEWRYFPAFPLIGALLAAEAVGCRWPSLRWVARGWATLVAISCVTLSKHGWISILGALATVAFASHLSAVWQMIQATAERVANSWQEWRVGPIRIINHGAYAGLAAFLAIWIDTVFTGPGHQTAILVAALAGVVGAALWAQYVEGSPQLLRPYGFYGGLLGGTLGALAAPLFHTGIWLLLAACSVSGPWAQATGRLRCLVQGCCHGRPSPANVGIRYTHPNSRVCRFTPWTSLPLHPTPVYSILWNAVLAVILLRLWMLHASLHLIVGLYFILTGVGRFVEEAWRGEPQTKVLAGLRLYQWAAIVSVVLGALFTAFDNGELAPDPTFQWRAIFTAAAFGFGVFCAMGVDFPKSQRRFSRLT
jgi:prolipoprotein diacylglyceryltransferase/protein-S-isoprenylcysteine O-methyltransferase Ste14